jgi:hypothetical protein
MSGAPIYFKALLEGSRLMLAAFQRLLTGLFDWLTCADPVSKGDLIFALAGRQTRKIFALELFSERRAPGLILSVGRFEIRRFANLPWPVPLDLLQTAASVPPPKRHFFVSFWDGESTAKLVKRGKFGTLSEIQTLAAWLKSHAGVDSVLVVSSCPHLRRVRLCCRALLPRSVQVRYLGAAEDASLLRDRWWNNKNARAMVLYELAKLLLYVVVLRLRKVR